MRIENNNNIIFGAYFKENKEFKKLLAKQCMGKPNFNKPELIDKFTHSMPPHEVEIINTKEGMSTTTYTFQNNHTKRTVDINTEYVEAFWLENLLAKLTSDSNASFWQKNAWTELYNSLIKKP